MSDWLPSLNALKAFEAVSRHLNYVRAAEELNVTPAAVKQLVHKLEATLGTQLVRRDGRGLTLTHTGRSSQECVSSGFNKLREAVSIMRAHEDRKQLIVSVEPSFATAWLVPRLERFRSENETIDVLIDSSLKLIDLEQGAADLAVRFGLKPRNDLLSYRLFDEELCAFCSPSLTTGADGLQNLDDLENASLLHWDLSHLVWAHATKQWMGWRPWLDKVGSGHIDSDRGIRFSDYNLAVQAAIAGQGVILGSLPVLRDLVEAGLLISPFPESVITDIGYDLVTAKRVFQRDEVATFWNWLIDEASSSTSLAKNN